MESQGSNVEAKQCPKCHKSIITGNRCGNAIINKAMSYVEIVKNIMLESASVPEVEREELRQLRHARPLERTCG